MVASGKRFGAFLIDAQYNGTRTHKCAVCDCNKPMHSWEFVSAPSWRYVNLSCPVCGTAVQLDVAPEASKSYLGDKGGIVL